MKLMLGYIDRRGGHTIIPIQPEEVEEKLKQLCKRRYEAVIWDANNRQNEFGWVYRHEEAGWSWCFDTDIMDQSPQLSRNIWDENMKVRYPETWQIAIGKKLTDEEYFNKWKQLNLKINNKEDHGKI